jgi:hypothetical protein
VTYFLELWRTNTPATTPIVRLVAEDDQQLYWQPDPDLMPRNWPTGYEWRLIPAEGSAHTAATWPADYSQPANVPPPTDPETSN